MQSVASRLKHRLGSTITFTLFDEEWSGIVYAIEMDVRHGEVLPVYHLGLHMGARDERGDARVCYPNTGDIEISDFRLYRLSHE